MSNYTTNPNRSLVGVNYASNCGDYATMGTYNSNCQRGIRPPVPTTNVSGYYIVPSYSAPGYETLTHGGGGCGSYFNIGQAYGYGAGNCQTQYMGTLCGYSAGCPSTRGCC